MALASFGRIHYPNPLMVPLTYSPNTADARFQAQATRVGRNFIVPPECDGKAVRHVFAHFGTAATPNEMRCGIYTLDTSGNPTTTGYDGGGDNYGSGTITANTTQDFTLSRDVTLTANQWASIVIEPHDADAVDCYLGSWLTAANFAPKQTRRYTAAWAQSTLNPAIGVLCTDGTTYLPLSASALATASSFFNFDNGTDPDENALKITVPFKCRVIGIWASTYMLAGADIEYVLYYGASNKSTGVIDGDNLATSTMPHEFMFDAGVEVDAGTVCYIASKPNTTTNAYLYYATMVAQGWMQACGLPSGSQRAYRTDAGAWNTTDTTSLPCIGLIIDQLDSGASAGGGGPRVASMNGGLS